MFNEAEMEGAKISIPVKYGESCDSSDYQDGHLMLMLEGGDWLSTSLFVTNVDESSGAQATSQIDAGANDVLF